jgi:acid phosphatase (class A)
MRSFHSSLNSRLAFVFLTLSAAATPLHAGENHYLMDGQPDAVALLAPPPLPNSAEQAADLAEVRSVSRTAPKDDVAAAREEKSFNVFNFAPAIGPFFQPGRFSKTEEFFHKVQKDADGAVGNAKDHWRRPRPYTVDPTLASGKLEKSFSYPSGHSTESMVLALVLADMFPEREDAILAHARNIGWHRVEIARHYPTDIYAGRVFAQAIVREMKKNPEFQRDFAAAKSEIAAAQQAARN